jgi:RNA-directed DNA polymerase
MGCSIRYVVKNLYPQICTFENLYLAFRAAAKGKRGKPEVAAFEQDLEPNLFRLHMTANQED